jgi:hypothetical protein
MLRTTICLQLAACAIMLSACGPDGDPAEPTDSATGGSGPQNTWDGGAGGALTGTSLTADHTSVEHFGDLSSSCVETIQSELALSYGHTSHGSQIVSGMEVLAGLDPTYAFVDDLAYYQAGSGESAAAGQLSLWDAFPGFGASDLGNPDRTTWEAATRRMLDNSEADFAVFPHLRNVVVWSWCGQAGTATEEDINTYLSLMAGLEQDYAAVTFVYMTGHLDGTGVDGTLHHSNQQIRAHVGADPSRVLFDFADIESYDPDGNYYLDRGANDNCDYDGGNWAEQWCAAHAEDVLCEPCSCAHSQALNCNRKARAFWWLLARMVGCAD